MARGKTGVEQRPNTLKENKRVLCELRNRIKNDPKTFKDFNKLIAKYNTNRPPNISRNAKASSGAKRTKFDLDYLPLTQKESPYGPMDGFPPGSWWGIRMDCARDRVHEPFNKDIQEGPYGAVSLCTSHLSTSNDVDLGDNLTFTADEYAPGERFSHPLLRSYENKLPLRLIRSYNLGNPYAPKTGYRYDGLYAVVHWWIGVTSSTEKNYKFALTRLTNQEPAIWQSSLKLAYRRKNSNGQQTRHSVYSINRRGNSLNIENDRRNNLNLRANSMKTSSRKSTISELSRIDGSSLNVERNCHESTIVTRCISHKKTDCSLSSGMVSVPYAESSPSSLNRQLDDSSMSALGKLQNTNISIRTDLYDSSNGSQQQDSKRLTPMTFSRTFKNSRIPARLINHPNVVALNLNSCGPCPRDNDQESLIQSRSGIGKLSTDQSPIFDANRSRDSSTPKSSISTQMEMKQIANDDRIDVPANSQQQSKNSMKEKAEERISDMEKIDDDLLKASNSIESSSLIAEKENRDCETTSTVSTAKSVEKIDDTATREEIVMKEGCTDLDSLTPDQMLNFIIKQKYHPTAKLLIGSVIGLATGESTILRVYESLISRKKRWIRDKTVRNDENELSSMSEKPDESVNSRESINLRSNVRNVGKSVAKNRICNENNDRLMKNARHRRTRVSKRLLGMDKMSSPKNLRKSNSRDSKTQKPFSKSTLLIKSKKRARKRRSELANLMIDANVGPIIRGPRNRRLRCTRHIFVKKIRPTKDVGNCCSSKSTEIVTRTRKETTDLPLRKSTRSNSMEKIQIDESSKRRKIVERPIVRNYQEERKIHAKNKGEKRKLSVDAGKNRERNSDELTKRLRNNDRKKVEIARKKMVDVATQCVSCRDIVVSHVDCENDGIRSENAQNMKIEWIDLEEVKSEIDSDDELSIERSNDVQNLRRTNQTSTRDEESSSRSAETPRLSAFVPVNISNNDSRIARLRSIGFIPIETAGLSCGKEKKLSGNDDENCPSERSNNPLENKAVASRKVDELFNKYTSEETTIVGYMDQELRYQDIENEERSANRKNRNAPTTENSGKRIEKLANAKNSKNGVKTGDDVFSIEEDSEVPWHGWKKFVNNKQEQWIGW